MAMPWKLAKAKQAAIEADETGRARERLNRLFNACFRIQAEASRSAGAWRCRWLRTSAARRAGSNGGMNFGSYYLWGDVGDHAHGVEAHVKVTWRHLTGTAAEPYKHSLRQSAAQAECPRHGTAPNAAGRAFRYSHELLLVRSSTPWSYRPGIARRCVAEFGGVGGRTARRGGARR